MAYAAGLGLTDERYFNTTSAGGVLAHPLFPVAPEWQMIVDASGHVDDGLDVGERVAGVHAGHDLVLHQPIGAGREVVISMRPVAAMGTRAGAKAVTRFDATSDDGAPVWTTHMTTIYRGIAVDGPDRAPLDLPVPPVRSDGPRAVIERSIDIGPNAAHVYTECARIWNPIHTDRAVALAAGLPDIILHGTATLALGVSAVLDHLDIDTTRVERLGCAFRSVVLMPNTLTVGIIEPAGGPNRSTTHFEITDRRGAVVVSAGYLVCRP
ncbi:MAG TPA: MaoC/PaaZ C-terminal domain-containing protein [Acidimicrobiales bacterium]